MTEKQIISEYKTKLLPSQKKGASTGASKRVKTETRHDALLLFNTAKLRLQDINNWNKLCGEASAVFQLTDSKGKPLYVSIPRKGNLIKIKLPAPGNEAGYGYDWVRIEDFENRKDLVKDEEVFGFRVRPVRNPLEHQNESAHFYTSDATSTFLVIRHSNIVTALEEGRNELPNTEPVSLFNKVRNLVIALAAMAGLSKPQWQSLVNGIINGRPVDHH